MSIPLLAIRIGIDPDMIHIGSFNLTWHGFLTFIAVALAVFLVARWGKQQGLVVDSIYNIATWCILGGIVGSRALHVIDLWDFYQHDPARIIQIWRGGIAIYGGILGGFVGGAGYILIRNHPRFLALWSKLFRGATLEPAPLPSVGRLADIAAPAMLIGMAVGRIGDVINGEHFANASDLPWAFVYTHPQIQALYANNVLNSLSPSPPRSRLRDPAGYCCPRVVLAVRDRLRPYGMTFALYLGLYSLGRFFISFLRLDKEWAIGLNEAQFVAIIVMGITIPLLAFKAQFLKVGGPRAARRRAAASGKDGPEDP